MSKSAKSNSKNQKSKGGNQPKNTTQAKNDQKKKTK